MVGSNGGESVKLTLPRQRMVLISHLLQLERFSLPKMIKLEKTQLISST
jgi:hypothetical protein